MTTMRVIWRVSWDNGLNTFLYEKLNLNSRAFLLCDALQCDTM